MKREDLNSKKKKSKPERELKTLKEKLDECEKKREEYLAGWRRERADFLNYQKENASRLETWEEKFLRDTLKEILVVADDLNLALASFSESGNDKLLEGLSLIYSRFKSILEKFGVIEMEVQPGEKFNPEFHEAVSLAESEKESGTILEVVERGYLIGEKVLRPARVKVAK